VDTEYSTVSAGRGAKEGEDSLVELEHLLVAMGMEGWLCGTGVQEAAIGAEDLVTKGVRIVHLLLQDGTVKFFAVDGAIPAGLDPSVMPAL
jgi:hypothetical protein